MTDQPAKAIGGRLLGAVLTVAGVVVVIWYYRLGADDRAALWGMFRGGMLWVGLAAVLPWSLFFVPAKIVRADSNVASAAMLAAYLLIDSALALYLAGGIPAATWQRAFLVLGLLCAAVYNFVVCESLARRAEDAL